MVYIFFLQNNDLLDYSKLFLWSSISMIVGYFKPKEVLIEYMKIKYHIMK
jgi:hypothetical protein